ncbi:MAG: hypothetical protein H7320_14215 [Ferruginibacter sp.]|nr:hypothetical protein [Ferruginibacter sp.]
MTLEQIKETQPDEQGIITITLEGQCRRFVKTMLLNHLQGKLPNKVGKHRKRPVIAVYPCGKEVPFNSSTEAATALGIQRYNIPHVLSGKHRHVGGFRFKYA